MITSAELLGRKIAYRKQTKELLQNLGRKLFHWAVRDPNTGEVRYLIDDDNPIGAREAQNEAERTGQHSIFVNRGRRYKHHILGNVYHGRPYNRNGDGREHKT